LHLRQRNFKINELYSTSVIAANKSVAVTKRPAVNPRPERASRHQTLARISAIGTDCEFSGVPASFV
jgi:hypothetical protein